MSTAPQAHRMGLSVEASKAAVCGEVLVLRESNEAEWKAQPKPLPLVTREFVKR